MTTKRLPWKPEYATNQELFWHDLDEFNKQYELENQQKEETIVEEPIVTENYDITPADKRKAYIKSLLEANKNA